MTAVDTVSLSSASLSLLSDDTGFFQALKKGHFLLSHSLLYVRLNLIIPGIQNVSVSN